MADRELKRRDEIEKRLDYISQQLGQLQIIKNLPDVKVMSQTLINSAMDVRSAVMRYLAIQIRHESSHFGIMGNLLIEQTNRSKSHNGLPQRQ
jgi:RecJ-like exonuclease